MRTALRSRTSEAGFTLVEMLVAAAILAFAMTAVVGIYQVTQRSALYAMAGEDAQTSVRAVLDRLAGDLRLINTGRAITTGFATAASATSITFLADIDNTGTSAPTLTALADIAATSLQVSSTSTFTVGGSIFLQDGPIGENHTLSAISGSTLTIDPALSPDGLAQWYPVGTTLGSVESVSWAWDSASQTLCRAVNAACTTPFSSSLTVGSGITSFSLTYLDVNRATIPDVSTQANRDLIREIRVEMRAQVRVGDQTVERRMEVTARPRGIQ